MGHFASGVSAGAATKLRSAMLAIAMVYVFPDRVIAQVAVVTNPNVAVPSESGRGVPANPPGMQRFSILQDTLEERAETLKRRGVDEPTVVPSMVPPLPEQAIKPRSAQ